MNPRHLELAEEFCKLVGTPHLLDYLGLETGVGASEARPKLKKRRKYMQGMQSNPKYKSEALFLIKNFAALDALLQDPAAYLEAVKRQQESEHLPILEMTIRGVLKGGQLTADQEEYLRRNALELGLSEQTFEDTLERLAAQAGIDRSPPTLDLEPDPVADEDPEITDHYGVLGVAPNASRDSVYDAYRARYREARALGDRQRAERLYEAIDRAWQVLSDPAARETYDLSLRQTGPPARTRESPQDLRNTFDDERLAPTAPPVRTRSKAPRNHETAPRPGPVSRSPARSLPPERRVARVEILGEPVRRVKVGAEPERIELRVRNTGKSPGRVSTDEPWLIANPTRLAPERGEQTITVRIDPKDLPRSRATGVVSLQTERGDRASIVFEVRRRLRPLPLVLAGVGLAAAATLVALLPGIGSGTEGVTIAVDPTAEELLVDGTPVGSGSLITLSEVPEGFVILTVLQPNFRTWTQEVDLSETGHLEVRLEREADLDFHPTDDLVPSPVADDVLQAAMAARTAGMDACARQGMAPGSSREGQVRVYLGRDGRAVGVDVEGEGTADPDIRECLLRQGATVQIPPLREGDYAMVRYDYRVEEAPP